MQSIQNFFQTEKWWGKVIFIIVTYVLYWCIFYWSLFLIPESFFETYKIPGLVTLFYAIIFIPALSFLIPHFLKKILTINTVLLYVLHTFLVLLSILLFF